MYQAKIDEFFSAFGESGILCLATAADEKVSARSMSFIICGEKFYFQTDKNFAKYSQICKNKNVALCVNNIQIEGVCREIGHPFDAENSWFSEKYEQLFKNSFESYSHLKTEGVFEVSPTKITVWKYEGSETFREVFDTAEKSFRKEKYLPE
ncbi:MAG: pyridoxamine 5'-phosphate oxidase family protein [Oscillospiraceae bacterium]